MQIGEINVVNSILNLENQVLVLQQTLAFIMANNKENLKIPTTKNLEEFELKAYQTLQRKYPKMGLEKK